MRIFKHHEHRDTITYTLRKWGIKRSILNQSASVEMCLEHKLNLVVHVSLQTTTQTEISSLNSVLMNAELFYGEL